ncbi:MAG: ABC transporter permease [Cyclobacteriaceae bacterium]
MNNQPPKWATNLLAWYCRPELLEDLEGDLFELFDYQCKKYGSQKANWFFIWYVFRSFRPSTLRFFNSTQTKRLMLTTHNFKIAVRVLWRNKFSSLLNISGLSIGIICFLVLGLYVLQETTFDRFHQKADRLYRSYLFENYGEGHTFFNSVTPFRFESLFEEDFPEIETAIQVRLINTQVGVFDKRINERIAIISPEFFQVFDFNVLKGSSQKPFDNRKSIILSRSYAEKYFGENDPIGKTIDIEMDEDFEPFTVSAVFDDMPFNSSISFEMAVSNELNNEIYSELTLNHWFTVSPETYILLREGTSIESVNDKMQDVVMSYLGEELQRDEYNIRFQPITDIHLNPEIPVGNSTVNNPKYVYILGFIGSMVLILACINYTTLAMGNSLKRNKEVAVRKVLGALRPILISQYLTESVIIASISTAIGTITTLLAIPVFNALTNSTLAYSFEWFHLAYFGGLGLLIGLVAGIYPVLALSRGKVLTLLQNTSQSKASHGVRKAMVIFQFAMTVFLLTSTLVMQKQLNFLQNKDLGFSYEASIAVEIPTDPTLQRMSERVVAAEQNHALLKAEISKSPKITDVTMGSHTFGSRTWAHMAFTDKNEVFRRFYFLQVDEHYLEAFDIKVITGRDFEEGSGLDKRQSIIINQAAVDYFGFENPIGEKLPGNEFGEHQIIGVIDDFHFSSLHNKVQPLVIAQSIQLIYQGISDADIGGSVLPKLLFKFQGQNLIEAEEILSESWDKIFPNQGLEFHFMDHAIQQQYESEAQLKKLITVASTIAIVIAAIGLLGLTVLVINSREKEIGIRKVMGASALQVFILLAKTYSIQLVIGIILSIPLTLWLMNDWLNNFAYKITLTPDLFIKSGLLALVIALLVVTYHTLKAALINPIESLRDE